MHLYEALQLARRFATAHDFLPHTRWLVRILRAIVESLVLAVLKTPTHVFVRCCVAFELVGDQYPRWEATLSQQFAHEPLGRIPVTPTLHQDIEHDSKLIYSAPQLMLLAIDSDDYFVQMPLVAEYRLSRPNPFGGLLTKLQRPAPNRFVCHLDTASSQHFLDHPKAQREAKIQPDRVADEFWRELVASVRYGRIFVGVLRFGGLLHRLHSVNLSSRARQVDNTDAPYPCHPCTG